MRGALLWVAFYHLVLTWGFETLHAGALLRQGAAFFDCAPWTDPEGNPVNFDNPPSEDAAGDWELIITEATDDDGWQYATQFRWDHTSPTHAFMFCNLVPSHLS